MDTTDLKKHAEEVLKKLRAVTSGSNVHDVGNHITRINGSIVLIDSYQEGCDRIRWKERLTINLKEAYNFLENTAKMLWKN